MNPVYCRRLVSRVTPSNTWYEAPCGDRITKKNSMDWCDGCRKEHLPVWPQYDEAELNPKEMGTVGYLKALTGGR